ncbi:hypothetical protein G5V59_10440 [Nocardioides sp. W3-2-3]|uniref:hypothetical protein n=1 Tax=Nocardioides convexus TaxID=2712224 RepID=UPI0024183C97|nr:hypothetical protein [Nocardioides convexus]NHA00371.1 hypothetical protein [Nocardioides convexus]
MHEATGTSLVRIGLESALGRPVPTGLLPCAGVAWFHAPEPPYDARRVLSYAGTDRVAALDDVVQARARVAAGSVLQPDLGTGQHVLYTQGRSADHASYLATCRAVEEPLRGDLRTAGRALLTNVSRTGLPGLVSLAAPK